MSDPTLQLEWVDQVAIVRLNDPATLNAITLSNVAAFLDTLHEIEARGRAMILTGAGKSFCSGANLSGGMGEEVSPDQIDAGLALETHINPLMQRLHDLQVPWISAVRGAAAGAGASLALAADLIVASETAYFLSAFSRIGLVPDAGATHLLVRTVGRPRAMEMMLLGEKLPAQTALAWGLVNRVVPDEQLETEALQLASRLAAGPASLRAIRKSAWRAVDCSWAESLQVEREQQLAAGRTADFGEGVAAFHGKRPARFTGQ